MTIHTLSEDNISAGSRQNIGLDAGVIVRPAVIIFNQKVTIRIFALNGVQVRKLEKHADASANVDQFFRWDLNNEAGLPVASGLYIAYIDMPDIGKTKVLKVFIVQSAEILQYF